MIIAVMKTIGAHVTVLVIVDGLRKVTYVGITKTVTFRPNGNIVGKTIYVYWVEKNGKIVELVDPVLIKLF